MSWKDTRNRAGNTVAGETLGTGQRRQMSFSIPERRECNALGSNAVRLHCNADNAFCIVFCTNVLLPSPICPRSSPVLSTRAPETQTPQRTGFAEASAVHLALAQGANSQKDCAMNPSTPEPQNPQGVTIQRGVGVPNTGPTAADLDHIRTPHAGGRP